MFCALIFSCSLWRILDIYSFLAAGMIYLYFIYLNFPHAKFKLKYFTKMFPNLKFNLWLDLILTTC